jgi:hypothetical protein
MNDTLSKWRNQNTAINWEVVFYLRKIVSLEGDMYFMISLLQITLKGW